MQVLVNSLQAASYKQQAASREQQVVRSKGAVSK